MRNFGQISYPIKKLSIQGVELYRSVCVTVTYIPTNEQLLGVLCIILYCKYVFLCINRLQMRSLRQYLREEVLRLNVTSTADHIVLTPEQEEAEFARCMQENEAWNHKISVERNERLLKERAQQAVKIRERLEAARVREEERMERIEEIVRREKELAKTFITHENLETAIEQALANTVDYNFSIDLQGNIYRGRTTLPDGKGTPANSGVPDNEVRQTIEASN